MQSAATWPRARLGCLVLALTISQASYAAQFLYALGAGTAPQQLPNILGGYLTDAVTGVAVDSSGYVYVTGLTYSPVFPMGTPIEITTLSRSQYLFIAKPTPDGSTFVYVKVIPGGAGAAIAVDQSGNAYVAGTVQESGMALPDITPSLNASSGDTPAFVLKLDSSGSQVLYLVYVGGASYQQASGLALDPAGNAYVTGYTLGPDFPTTSGAFETDLKGSQAVFVTKINASGTALLYSTLLSGSGYDQGAAIAVDANGAAYVTGNTTSPDFPITTGAYRQQIPPPEAGFYVPTAFVTKLNATGTALVYSTYLAGTGETRGNGIAVDAGGNAYVAGAGPPSYSQVTIGVSQTSGQTQGTAFVTKLDATGTGLVYSTLFGAVSANAIAVDAQGNAHITGDTYDGLPVYQPFQPSYYPTVCYVYTASGTSVYGYVPCADAFVAGLDHSGSTLLYSTYLNGSLNDSGLAIAVDQQGNTYAGGYGALTLASTNPLSNNGGAFVVKLRQTGAPPFFTRQSIANAAGFSAGLVPQGGLASIFCSGLTGVSGVVEGAGYPLLTELAGVQVKIDGIPAPLWSISDANGQQINLQVPFEAGQQGSPLDVEISQNGLTAWIPQVDTRSTAPGLFASPDGYGAIQHAADYSPVTPESPAQPGEIVILYGTGLGLVTPAVASGTPAPQAVSVTNLTPTVTIGGLAANVLFSGLAPSLVGVYQLNVQVPPNASSGDREVVVSFPPYQVCCTGGGAAIQYTTVYLNSNPVKLPVD